MTRISDMHPVTRALIDLSAFAQNVRAVRSYVGERVRIMAVVKANAYGHGLERIAVEALKHGADCLGVARVHEGVELRKAGVEKDILVFEVTFPEQVEFAVNYSLALTVSSIPGARYTNEVAERLGRKIRVHVKVDTGMGRLGFHHTVAATMVEEIARLRRLEIEGVYSHFATSEEPENGFAREQVGSFVNVLEEVRRKHVEFPLSHMANSGAIMTLPESHFSVVRPGILLYGYPPKNAMKQKFPVKPVMSLTSRVAFLKCVDVGTSISYGRKYTAPTRTSIATVPIGYGDGYSRLLTGKAFVLIHGVRYPVVGAICMDHLMVNVGPETDVHEGDEVTLLGNDGHESISAWDLAAQIGTIPYEVTCLVTPRIPRVYFP